MVTTIVIVIWFLSGSLGVYIHNKVEKDDLIIHWCMLGPIALLFSIFSCIQAFIDRKRDAN